MGEPRRAKALKASRRAPRPASRYSEIASVFIRLGIFGFGGPIATMAMMEEDAVRRRGWLTPDEFGEVYAVCKLLPGPVSTQMAIYLGRLRGGILGGVLAGGLYVLPCFLMVLGLSVLYAETGIIHGAEAVLAGLQAAALAVIAVSTWGLSRPYRKVAMAWVIAVVSAALIYRFSSWEPVVILGFGLLGVAKTLAWRHRAAALAAVAALGSLATAREALASTVGGQGADRLLLLFWTCFKAGMFVFGTGLAVVPVLEGDAVTRYHWLTHSQFMDGLAVGQITPGPVVITSTFIGYLAARLPGALAATFGMFLPSFFNVLFLVPRIWKRFSGTPAAHAFSAYAIPAVIGGIIGTTIKLGIITVVAWQPAVVLSVALLVALLWNPPAWILIPVAGVAGGVLGLH